MRLGKRVGCNVGLGLGSELGSGDGTEVGTSVGTGVGKGMGKVKDVNVSWEASHIALDGSVVINKPPQPKQIWFTGSGSVNAVWDALARPDELEVPLPNGQGTQPRMCAELQAQWGGSSFSIFGKDCT